MFTGMMDLVYLLEKMTNGKVLFSQQRLLIILNLKELVLLALKGDLQKLGMPHRQTHVKLIVLVISIVLLTDSSCYIFDSNFGISYFPAH